MKVARYDPRAKRWAVITAVSTWALSSLLFWIHGDDVSPVHCLILGAMALGIILPSGIKRWVTNKWFPLIMAMWLLVMIPMAWFAFNASAGLGNKCTHLYIPLGVFGCVFTLGWWGLCTLRDSARARKGRTASGRVSTQLPSDSEDERKQGRQSAAACEPS